MSAAPACTKLVSGGHLIFWVLLVFVLIFARPVTNGLFDTYLTVLLAAAAFFSLFDIVDLWSWRSGDCCVPASNQRIAT